MSEEYDISADAGEIADPAIDETIASRRGDDPRPEDEPPEGNFVENSIETSPEQKTKRKKERSAKQIATFEKARKKRLENIAKRKKERTAGRGAEEKGKETVAPEPAPVQPNPTVAPPGEINTPNQDTELIKHLQDEVQSQIGAGDKPPILKKPNRTQGSRRPIKQKKAKKQKFIYLTDSGDDYSEESSSSSEEEVIYVKKKPRQKKRKPKKVYYEEDYAMDAPEATMLGGHYQKPMSYSDVFKYA